MEYPHLFTPGRIGPVTVKNRLVMTAMCVGLAHHDGAVSDALAAYYEERAAGGVGLMITECTRVNETDAVAYPSMLSMSHDRYIEPLRKSGGTGARPWSQAVYAALPPRTAKCGALSDHLAV